MRFLGSRQDVPALMNAADGLVLSSAVEGLPLVLLEAVCTIFETLNRTEAVDPAKILRTIAYSHPVYTGASVAALTLYDMAKAVSPGIVIREIRLLEKQGGKTDYRAPRG